MGNASGERDTPKADQPAVQMTQAKRDKYQIAADILDSIEDYISAFDHDWNILYISKKTAEDFGCTIEELMGKNFWKIFPKFVGTAIERNYLEAMAKREVRRFEWETIYAHTGWREFTVFPSAEGVTVYGVDITERKKLQFKLEEYTKNLEQTVEARTRKIRESEQSYRELYESFGEAFIATDWELNIIHWNKAAEKITNVAATDALGKKIIEVLPEMATVNVTPYFEELQKRKPARFMMNITSRQTGKAALFEVSTYPSTNGIIIIVEDKTVEEETKRLLTIGQTAGMVGHDIRNPLQSITSSMFLIKNDLDSFPTSEERENALFELNSVVEQITYVDKIVADLQDYARPLKIEAFEVDLGSLISNTLAGIRIPENITTSTAIDESIRRLRIDAVLLKRVLVNLATNAIQAMPQGGKLTIRANRKGAGELLIEVEDTGVGIPDEVKPKMFTPLFTTKAKGQGFGLAVVKRLVETQGGTISFESQEGKGTKFTVKLPVMD